MVGMSSMLLRVLFSSRPVMMRNCSTKTKMEKSALESRCRCERCLLKQKKDEKASTPVKLEDINIGWEADNPPSQQNSEEIVLKVTTFQK